MSTSDLNGAMVPGFIFLLGGIMLFVYCVWTASVYATLKHWIKIQGTVIESHLDHKDPYNANNPTGRNYVIKDTVYYRPAIKYKYRHHGQEYIGTRVSFSANWVHSLTKAFSYVVGLKHGSTIPVYIDPHRPIKSVLVVDDKPTLVLPVIASLGFIVIGTIEISWAMNTLP